MLPAQDSVFSGLGDGGWRGADPGTFIKAQGVRQWDPLVGFDGDSIAVH